MPIRLLTTILTSALLSCVFSFVAYSEKSNESIFDFSLEELVEIKIVTASKRPEKISEAPSVVSVVTAQEIARMNAVNLIEVLNHVASVYMINTYAWSGNLSTIRGDVETHYDTHTLILLNGRPIRDSIFGGLNQSVYHGFPIDAISRIEVIRGPGSVLYGTGAFTGVINIITHSGEEAVNKIRVGAGSFDRRIVSATGTKLFEKLELRGSAQLFDEQGWRYGFTDEAGVYDNDPRPSPNFGAVGQARYGDFTLDVFWNEMDFDRLTPIPTWPLEVNNHIQRGMINLGWERAVSEKVTLNADVTYNRLEMRKSEGNDPKQRSQASDDVLFEVSAQIRINEKMNVLVGGSVNRKSGSLKTTGFDDYLVPPYTLVDTAGYVQFDYKPIEKLKLVLGAQVNKPENLNTDVVPRVALIAQFTKKFGGKLLYGEAYRSGSAFETEFANHPAIEGNPQLEPENVASTELQLFYDALRWRVAVTGFYSEQDDMIRRIPNPDPSGATFTYANLDADTHFKGVEIEGTFYPNELFNFKASYMYQENEADGFDNFTFMPNTLAKFSAHSTFSDTGFDLGLFYRFIGDAHDVANLTSGRVAANPGTSDYHMADLNLGADLNTLLALNSSRTYKVGVSVKNILDEDVHIPEFNRRRINTLPNAPGRSVYGFLNITF